MPLLSCKQQAKTGPLACGGPGSAMHHSLALALHRIRDTQVSDAFATPIHFSNSPPRSRDAFCARAFAFCFAHPIEGWAERRETFGCLRDTRRARRIASKTRVNALMTQRARRLRGALRPMTRDARLSALHRGGFGLGAALLSPAPPPLALRPASGSVTASSSHPGRSAWRAGSLPPEAAVTTRRRRTPLPAPPSGSSLEDAPQ